MLMMSTSTTDGSAAGERCGCVFCAAWVAAPAAADAEATVLTLARLTVGTPVVLPALPMLAPLTTVSATRLTLPDDRMPASPASIVPNGATRLMSPAATEEIGASVAMPAPALGVVGESWMLP